MRASHLLDVGWGIHEDLDTVRRHKTSFLAQALHPVDELPSSARVNHFLTAKMIVRTFMEKERGGKEIKNLSLV
jgi:hypothetical protein